MPELEQPLVPMANVTHQFQAAPANIEAIKADFGGTPGVILITRTPTTCVVTFWELPKFWQKLDEMREATNAPVIATAADLQSLRMPSAAPGRN